jgi:hypothetical protein
MCRSIKSLLADIYILSACWRSVLTICPNISEYPYSVYLDKSHHFEFSWRVDYAKELVHFRVCLDSHPASVFGVGFSNYGEMENSDFVIYWTSESGVHHFQVCTYKIFILKIKKMPHPKLRQASLFYFLLRTK